MELHEKLYNFRQYVQMSRNSFAKKIHCSTTQLKRYEEGITPIPFNLINTIIAKFKVNPLFFEEDMNVEDAVTLPKNKEERNTEIAQRIKERRMELNLSQKELSILSHITESRISQIETMHSTLTPANAEKLANALETSTEWLLEGKDEYKKNPVNQTLIEWLWKHPDEREILWEMIHRDTL